MGPNLTLLNEQYAIPGHVSFHSGPGSLDMAVVNNGYATATMTLAGGHVMSYTPHNGQPLLWMSPKAAFSVGRAMRGGVPVCWPWFAGHPSGLESMPLHGFARTRLWTLAATCVLDDGSTQIHMTLSDSEETQALWPYTFWLELIVTVGRKLRIEWVARNPGSRPFQYTGALHPYFSVSDTRSVTVRGLDGTDYLDKVDNFQRKTQTGDVTFTGWTDRIYLNTTRHLQIEDPGFGRTIHLHKIGSRTTVVWNPDFTAAQMADVGEGEEKHFICVEAANAVDDVVTVDPDGEARLGMEIEIV